MTGRERVVDGILATAGGVAGAFAGYQIFFWLVGQGYYGMMIPGAMLGLGCGLLARESSQVRGLICAVTGVVLGVYTEWQFAPFKADGSLSYLVMHLHQIVPIHLIMILLGAVFAYWLGKDGGLGRIVPRKAPSPPEV
jgi:hypothetical protein